MTSMTLQDKKYMDYMNTRNSVFLNTTKAKKQTNVLKSIDNI